MTISGNVDDAKPVCVVIDTNIWRSELLLKSARGAALLYNLRQSNSFLGMPEVIEREIVKHAVAAGTEFVEAIETNVRMLSALMGSGPGIKVPSEHELKANAQARLDEMKSLFISVPFTLEHAKSALDRVDSGKPPNGPKKQQFKDSAIWEAIIELAHTYRTHFLTTDKAFYKDFENPTKGLAPNLSEECRKIGAVIILHRDISSCLEHLHKYAVPLDQSELAAAIEPKLPLWEKLLLTGTSALPATVQMLRSLPSQPKNWTRSLLRLS